MSVYFDASDFLLHLTHSDSVTGIQRVTQQAILNAPKSSGAKPVYFSYTTERFYELPAELFDFQIKENRLLLRRLGLHLARTITGADGNRALTWLRNRVSEYLLETKVPFGRKISIPGVKPVEFERGDQLVFVGAIWGMDNYVEKLREVSERHGLALTFFCHDTVPVLFPYLVENDTAARFLKYMQSILPICSAFICNSESTKSDLQKFLKEQQVEIPIHVMRLAHEFVFPSAGAGAAAPSVPRALLQSKFALCVGTVEPRKNHLRLALAFRAALQKLGDSALHLVVAGKQGWGVDEFYRLMADTKRLQGRITLIENPSDADLDSLYRTCDFTVYPSLFEGWGLPVGESLWFRKRCIASRVGGIPEAGADAVDYFDPSSVDSIAAAIVRHASEPEVITRFNEKVAGARLRSWADFGADMVKTLSTRMHPASTGTQPAQSASSDAFSPG